jgi:tetratricopeptide (TPR) repeat protein
MRTVARLRLAGLLLDAKQYDEALKQLDAPRVARLRGLVADRRGDVLLAQGKPAEAKAAYQAAYKGMDDKLDYRRLVEAKLTALGARAGAPAAAAAFGRAPVSGLGRGGRDGVLAACGAWLLAGCCWLLAGIGRQAQADAAGALHAQDRRPPGLAGQRRQRRFPLAWPCATASSSSPAATARAGARGRHRARAWRGQAGARCRPASAATAALPPSSRADNEVVTFEAAASVWRKRVPSAW